MRILPLLLLCLVSCGENDEVTPVHPVPVDGERAYADLVDLCAKYGDRRIGTPGSKGARDWIVSRLEPLGWEFEEDPFTAQPPAGARRKGVVEGCNLLARWPGSQPGEIWLAGHYDTFDLPGFVGANDSGSSTALLVELGRQLAGDRPRPGPSIVLCWFDGEERFPPVLWDNKTNSTFGSRHLAAKLKAEEKINQINALILLDMVGDQQLGLFVESSSTGWMKDLFHRTAQGLGEHPLIVGSREIPDDHMHFRNAGVPFITLIDFHFGPGHGWWHTREDTPGHCSAESLARTGTLVLSALPAVESRAKPR